MIAYPPLESEKGIPLLSQNRQFQWFKHHPAYIYPVVPATGATLLKKDGYNAIWADGIAEEWSYQEFLSFVEQEKPNLVVMETKTPVVKKHWKIIDDLKNLASGTWPLTTVLVGDHVTALPEESMENSAVDYILTGGDYDFLLLNLCNYLKANKNYQLPITNYQLPRLEPGIWYREDGEAKNTGRFQLDHDLNEAPFIDRDLTKWELYAYKIGNYKKLPGTYIMAGRDCWWAKCRFCSWVTLYPKYRVRTPKNVLDEIGMLIETYQVREIMDDTGTFPAGAWLEKFCQGMIERGYHKKVRIDCNMRPGRLTKKQYQLMGEAGFRMILYGLESADQEILDRVHKGTKADDIVKD
ncbi:MAG: radical SAM protein, partial [Actinomycetota bacterium]